MDVRRYEAFSIQDAVKLIKKEMGRDAIILATREKHKEVPGSDKPVKMVEVVAARSARALENDGKGDDDKDKDVHPAVFPTIQRESDMRIVRGTPTVGGLRPGARSELQQQNQATSEPVPTRTTQQMPSLPVMQAEAPQLPRELSEVREELGRLRREMQALPQVNVASEVQELKILLHDLVRSNAQRTEFARFPEYLTNMAVRLRTAGILEPLLMELLNGVAELPVPKAPDGTELTGEKLKEFHFNALIRALFKRMTTTGALKGGKSGQRIFCLVGPTGVGKTTTIAKLAADFRLTENTRVAMVSMDSFRIAGADQLRAYARILDCPFLETDDPGELAGFVRKQHNAEYVFIDTAGRSARNQEQIQRLKRLRSIEIPISFHLVLASTMKQRDMDETIRAYGALGLDSIIFTKLDESWNYGEIFNAAARSRVALSYFATGQRVPEDLEVATKERVVERLFQI